MLKLLLLLLLPKLVVKLAVVSKGLEAVGVDSAVVGVALLVVLVLSAAGVVVGADFDVGVVLLVALMLAAAAVLLL